MARDRIARILLDATRSGTKNRRARARKKKNRPTDRPTDRPNVVESELVDAARSNKVRALADVSMICIDLTDSSYG